MSILIDKKVFGQFSGSWTQTPIAKAFSQAISKQSSQDHFVITAQDLEKIVQQIGGYECHPAPLALTLCKKDELKAALEKTTMRLYRSLLSIAGDTSENGDSFIDNENEVGQVKALLNSENEFLEEGGVKIIEEGIFINGNIKYGIEALCANPEKVNVYHQFQNADQFYKSLKYFFSQSDQVSWKAKLLRPTIKIDVARLFRSSEPNKSYLTLYAGWGPFKRALVVRLLYKEQEDEQSIEWEVLHKNKSYSFKEEAELVQAMKISSAQKKLKALFLDDKHSIEAKGAITINTTTHLATSEVECKKEYQESAYTIMSGILNFLLYSCGDARVHSGIPIRAFSPTSTDFTLKVRLPGLE